MLSLLHHISPFGGSPRVGVAEYVLGGGYPFEGSCASEYVKGILLL